MYSYRCKAKTNGDHKLATTLKFLMNSCWGYSIRKPKVIIHKYTKNINNYIETYAPFVIGYSKKDINEGYVDTITSFIPHFTCPQFAKSVLDKFSSIMNDIKKHVNFYYENIDAILISEEDYFKLVDLGYIGDKLGQFKIEHIFTEIAIKPPKQYVATLESGEFMFHLAKKGHYTEKNYADFVVSVKNSI